MEIDKNNIYQEDKNNIYREFAAAFGGAAA